MTEWLFTKTDQKRLCRLHEHITAVKERVMIKGTNAVKFYICKIKLASKVLHNIHIEINVYFMQDF